jgi:hypothetical protein
LRIELSIRLDPLDPISIQFFIALHAFVLDARQRARDRPGESTSSSPTSLAAMGRAFVRLSESFAAT